MPFRLANFIRCLRVWHTAIIMTPNDWPARATPCAVPVYADSGLGCTAGFGREDISQYDTNRGWRRAIHALSVKSLGWSLNMEDHRAKGRFSPQLTCLVSELRPKTALLSQSRRPT